MPPMCSGADDVGVRFILYVCTTKTSRHESVFTHAPYPRSKTHWGRCVSLRIDKHISH